MGTHVDYKLSDVDSPVFQTCPEEKSAVIMQLGTSCPERAVKAAKLCEADIAGVDVNMGCPKDYSTKGGMGASLMSTLDRAVAILTSLVKNLRIPVSAKIRCYSDTQKTVDFAKRLEATGISALAIPVLSNGGSNYFTDLAGIHKFQAETNTAGVLVARAAMWNPSIFDEKGPLEMETVVKEYVTIAMKYNFGYELMKYNILNIMRGEQQHDERGLTTRQALTSWQIAAAWGIEVEENEGIAMKRRKIVIFPY